MQSLYPEYLNDWDVLICPSFAGGADAVEAYDEGNTPNPLWSQVAGFSNNGEVEPCEITVEPYYYYGWAFADSLFQAQQDFVNFQTAVDEFETDLLGGNVAVVAADLDLPGGPVNGKESIPRLREGIERFFITDINNAAASSQAQSTIAVMHDAVSEEATHYNHVPGGVNVLYMDGHVEFLKWVAGGEPTNP
ncbi:MAG: hypothetical protein HYV26_02565, partial [Candidatus Hydrogenedentes bacterium]|nr:hypothetical protein [Candidatus Hydrogenedentota bacterium]